MANARLVVFEGVGHLGHLVNEALLDFLAHESISTTGPLAISCALDDSQPPLRDDWKIVRNSPREQRDMKGSTEPGAPAGIGPLS